MKQKTMKCLLVLALMASIRARSQVNDWEIQLLHQLDSVRQSASPARHFAEIYYSTTGKAILFAASRNGSEQLFLQRFETHFAGLFFRAAAAAAGQDSLPPVWTPYFSSDTFHPVRLQLLGINAHINGDIFQVLTQNFSAAEIRRNKQVYFAFNHDLKKEFDEFYELAARRDARFAIARELSPGLTRAIGHRLLIRWRKKQYNLALVYFRDPTLFRKKYARVSKKRESLNRLICSHF